jgi:dipeptidyl aminopeptidase/acylaminoacyl peptidase
MAPEHWQGRSPIYNLDKIKTPTLLLWGDRDGVRISSCDIFFAAMQKAGKYCEYIQYNCEPHGWYHWRPEDLGDSLRRMTYHFQKFISE